MRSPIDSVPDDTIRPPTAKPKFVTVLHDREEEHNSMPVVKTVERKVCRYCHKALDEPMQTLPAEQMVDELLHHDVTSEDYTLAPPVPDEKSSALSDKITSNCCCTPKRSSKSSTNVQFTAPSDIGHQTTALTLEKKPITKSHSFIKLGSSHQKSMPGSALQMRRDKEGRLQLIREG